MLGGEANRVLIFHLLRKNSINTIWCVITKISSRTTLGLIRAKIVGEVGGNECSLDDIPGNTAIAG
jgi:hypothetical protein